MRTIHKLSYPIYIEEHQYTTFQDVFKKHVNQTRVFVITDTNVWLKHKDMFIEMVSGLDMEVIELEPGEGSKSFEVFQSTIERLIEKEIKRDDVLIAFGGGVIGDLTGYIASSLFRGISLIHIPTTVIAQVDSSIGSKTGINTALGKNLVGAFKDPLFVYTFVPFLTSLSEREFNNGMAEVIKAGAIYEATIIEDLLKKPFDVDVLYKAINVKVDVVSQDKYESQLRMILNFGHTLGHAIEKANQFKNIKHGEAISLGMKYALDLGEKLGITNPDASKKVIDVLNKYQLLDRKAESIHMYLPFIKVDKKQRNDGLHFIFIESLGKASIKRIKEEDLYEC